MNPIFKIPPIQVPESVMNKYRRDKEIERKYGVRPNIPYKIQGKPGKYFFLYPIQNNDLEGVFQDFERSYRCVIPYKWVINDTIVE